MDLCSGLPGKTHRLEERHSHVLREAAGRPYHSKKVRTGDGITAFPKSSTLGRRNSVLPQQADDSRVNCGYRSCGRNGLQRRPAAARYYSWSGNKGPRARAAGEGAESRRTYIERRGTDRARSKNLSACISGIARKNFRHIGGDSGRWRIDIPQSYRVAHGRISARSFRTPVTTDDTGRSPNMLAKYYVTTALEMAKNK